MSLQLPYPSPKYDVGDQAQTRAAVEAADAQTYKRGQDIEIGATQRLILNDTTTGTRYRITVESGQILVRTLAGTQVYATVPVIATASLPAAGAAQDGRLVIEDAGAGDRNLIIYAGGERFRIDGGATF